MAEKRVIVVTALVNLVYDKDQVNIGEKLKIRETDLKDLAERGFVEEVPKESKAPINDEKEDNEGPEGE